MINIKSIKDKLLQKEYINNAISLFSIIALLSFQLFVIDLVKNKNRKIVPTVLIILGLISIALLCSLAYYKLYKIENKVNLEDNHSSESFNKPDNQSKSLYKNNEYLQVKKLVQIRWASRILIGVLLINLAIIVKMGSKNPNFQDGLVPVLFLLMIIINFTIFNNFLTKKIENGIAKFDKDISNLIQGNKNLNQNDFLIFNQLMLERDNLTKSININSFEDSIKEQDSIKSFLQKIFEFIGSAFISIGSELKSLFQKKDLNYQDAKINDNLKIFNSFMEKDEQKIKPENISEDIKNINKDSGLLKQSDTQGSCFKMLDALMIQDSFFKVFK
jgi:hypothetical protein